MESATAVYYIKTTFIGSFGSVFQKIRPEKVYGNLIDPCQVSSFFLYQNNFQLSDPSGEYFRSDPP